MKKPNAMAFVKWSQYRRSDEDHYNPPQFFYGSKKKRIQNLVGNGGTLWVVTSRLKLGKRGYSLAYKLVNCCSKTPNNQQSKYGQYMVQSRDWRNCHYYSFEHDITNDLLNLSFMQPGDKPGMIGQRILTARSLTPEDINLLETLEDKLISQRMVFISYSTKDRSYAQKLEQELLDRDVNTWRDVGGLELGADWEITLKHIASGTDCFLVLVSKNAAESKWVKQEIEWAIKSMKENKGLVKKIIPIILEENQFPEFKRLKKYQECKWPENSVRKKVFDKLANEIKEISPRKIK